MGWAGKPRIVPDKIGNRSYSNKATPPSKPAQSGNSTSQGFNPIEAIGSFIFGSNQQQNQNQGNTYNNTPVEQKNQKYVVSGYSDKTKYGGFASKEAQERALAAAMQKSASRFSGAWAKAGVPKHIISASIQYKPYGAGQQGAVSNSSPNQNVGQANIHNQSSTNAQPIPETTDNPYIITNGQAGLVGGYNGNTNTVDNVNVVPSAQNAALSSLAGLYVNAELKDGAQTSTINQTQNMYSSDLPLDRTDFSKAAETVSFQSHDTGNAMNPATDSRWNMNQGLYQKALQHEDPLIIMQQNPRINPNNQFMQQQGDNITPLNNYDAFLGNFQGNEAQKFKESNLLYPVLLIAGVGAFIILRSKF